MIVRVIHTYPFILTYQAYQWVMFFPHLQTYTIYARHPPHILAARRLLAHQTAGSCPDPATSASDSTAAACDWMACVMGAVTANSKQAWTSDIFSDHLASR